MNKAHLPLVAELAPGDTGNFISDTTCKSTWLGTQDEAGLRHAKCGKALAIYLYNIGAATPPETKAMFHRHPEWRTA